MSKKLPALQFYPGDWRKDPGVQALDYFDRGVWWEVLLLMHEAQPRGHLMLNGQPMPDDATARLLSLPARKWREVRARLIEYGVASETDEGVLYCRRMVRDEELRQTRAAAGGKGGRSKGGSKEGSKSGSNPPSKTEAKRKQRGKQKDPPSVSSSVSVSTSVDDDGLAGIDQAEDDPVAELAAAFPAAAAALKRMTHPGGWPGTIANLRQRFLYPTPREGMPDTSVDGLEYDARLRIVAEALVEMQGAGADWSPRALAGFVRRLRTAPDPEGDRPKETSAAEEASIRRKREAARARGQKARDASESERWDRHREDLSTSKAWYDDQPEEVQATVDRKVEAASRKAGKIGETQAFLEGSFVQAVRQLRSDAREEAVA